MLSSAPGSFLLISNSLMRYDVFSVLDNTVYTASSSVPAASLEVLSRLLLYPGCDNRFALSSLSQVRPM